MMVGALLTTGALLASSYLWPKSHYMRLPVSFSDAGIPIIEAKLGEAFHPLKLYLESQHELVLNEQLLATLEKRKARPYSWKDRNDNLHNELSYFLPSFNLGNLVWKEVFVEVASEERYRADLLRLEDQDEETYQPPSSVDIIGGTLFRNHVLFLNFHDQSIVVCDDLADLKREGIAMDQWREIHLQIYPWAIFLEVETDLGTKRFRLSTGSSVTAMASSQLGELPLEEGEYGLEAYLSSRFSLNGEEFGPKKLYPCDLNCLAETDGIVGMDFLKEHSMILDLPNQIAYIEPASK